jgi:hypothetical protein
MVVVSLGLGLCFVVLCLGCFLDSVELIESSFFCWTFVIVLLAFLGLPVMNG